MKKIGIFLAEGYEEIEALTVADICRRCGLDVSLVSITEERMVKSSHNVAVQADLCLSEADFGTYDNAGDEESGGLR